MGKDKQPAGASRRGLPIPVALVEGSVPGAVAGARPGFVHVRYDGVAGIVEARKGAEAKRVGRVLALPD